MEHNLSTVETTMAQLIFQMEGLEVQVMSKKAKGQTTNKKTTSEKLTQLKNQMDSNELRYVSHFHSFLNFLSALSSPPLPSPLSMCYITFLKYFS
jgi:hypothetical protein